MKIAVVILNWNGEKLLQQFLPLVIENSQEADVYVVDNDSTDQSVLIIKNRFPSVKIIQNKENFGFAEGYNLALKLIDAEVYALVNSDVEVTKNWLQPIINTFNNEPEIAIIQPKILDYKNKTHFEYAGAAGGFIDQFGYPFCRGRIFETLEKDEKQYDNDCEIFWASGACFFIKSNVYHLLKGFDADFFAHQEEIDLCWRAYNIGYKTKFVSKSIVYHVGAATLEQGNPRKTFLNFRNSLLMLTKNLPKKTLFLILFFRLILDGLAGIQFLFKGKWKHFCAIIKAHFEFYYLFNKNYKKRNLNQKYAYYKVKSIVYSYYIKRKVTFRNLF